MNKLSEAIEQAKNDCLLNGNGFVKLDNNINIHAEWITEDNYDIIEIEIENKNMFVCYQLEETKTY